jgi:hypothetical protein
MNTRLDQIDILRGIFFIPMFIYHIFSFYDLYNNTTLSDNPIINKPIQDNDNAAKSKLNNKDPILNEAFTGLSKYCKGYFI